ncbi:hypothetical protein INT47_009190 [Mucor saturninus]|uniref:Phosphatidic acid phosphatase type 2/haloperoxidase domain-containing protein n=1 Tax=Mucor saturninus TaxID=64648 RepID=A0A8H7V7Z3_9FUNG|nr:hypothetical protein INT47_009190 [Mucor saturninus]
MAKSMKKGFLNILSYTRELVLTCNFLTVLYLRSFHIVYFTLTAATTVISAKILKRIIKQARPPPRVTASGKTQKQKKSYGMPSSHSSAIFFLNTYLQCLFNAAFTWQNICILVFFHGFAISVVWSRVRLGHHTESQVIAGSLFGFSCALVAFYLWKNYFSAFDLDGHIDGVFTHVLQLRTR